MGTIKNQVQLMGNVGRDPTVTILENGQKIVRFSLAENHRS
ncbi:MAG TPA: single-stranded DNA-binding protein [Arenibacter sp.]|nr:single-stranded DNA-binding protein [Arenibacter sp.]